MTMPKRIQRKRTKGWKMPEGAVYVGRPTVFGNPCACARPYGCPLHPEFERWAWEEDDGTVSPLRCCLAVYRHYIETGLANEPTSTGRFWFALQGEAGYPHRQELIRRLPELRGKDLACWCPLDRECHADILLQLANRP